MILKLLVFFVGVILLLLIPVIALKRNSNQKHNNYFLIILSIAGIQRFLLSLEVFGIIDTFINPFKESLTFTYFIPPIYFLFFENFLLKKTTIKKEILLFGVAFMFFITTITFNYSRDINQYIFLIYSTIYYLFIGKIIWEYVLKNKTIKTNTHYTSVKSWTIIMFVLFTIIYVFANYTFNIDIYQKQKIILTNFYNYTSVIWLLIVIYMLMNPKILYGEQLLLKILNKSTDKQIKIWKSLKTTITEKADLKVEQKVKPNLDEILFLIKKFENDLQENFNGLPSLKILANNLKQPQSHLKYVFKYYSNYKYSEYQNVLKIQYALKLIHSNYLDSHTIDSLGTQCDFNSRITFFNNFKKITGYSSTEYLLMLSKS
tara:strand:- start:1487 stop:2608 length:1122 start_codon:yes stop_codon:yes gene_type:complete